MVIFENKTVLLWRRNVSRFFSILAPTHPCAHRPPAWLLNEGQSEHAPNPVWWESIWSICFTEQWFRSVCLLGHISTETVVWQHCHANQVFNSRRRRSTPSVPTHNILPTRIQSYMLPYEHAPVFFMFYFTLYVLKTTLSNHLAAIYLASLIFLCLTVSNFCFVWELLGPSNMNMGYWYCDKLPLFFFPSNRSNTTGHHFHSPTGD